MIYSTPIQLNCESQIREWVLADLEIKKATSQLIIKTQYRAQHHMPKDLLDAVNNELNSMGIPNVSWMDSYVRRPGSKQYLHVDGHDFPLFCAVNIPLSGVIGSRFEYYGGDYTVEKKSAKGLTWFEPIWNRPPELIENLELTTSHLVRIDIPHMAVANDHEPRSIVSMRFEGNPSYEYVRDCIIRNKQ